MSKIRVVPAALVAGLAILLNGCTKNNSSEQQQAPVMQVVVVEAWRQPVSETLSLVGTITANEMVEIKSETDGIVQEVLFEEGHPVKKGELLLRLDESKLAASTAEAEANFKLSKANFDRSQQLHQGKLISQQEFDQSASSFAMTEATLELKRRQLKDARIYAPFEGVVGARNISPGQVIAKNMTLTWLVDLDPVKVEFDVPERFVGQVKIGQKIEFPVAAYLGKYFVGEVFFISPFVDPANRTALIKAQIPNPQHELKPGMFANLDLTLTVRENSVVIPEAALARVLEDNRAMVFLVDQAQTVQTKQVKLGVRLAGQVEILDGLTGGEKVVVEGVQKIGPGSKVKLAPPESAAPYLPAEKKPVLPQRS